MGKERRQRQKLHLSVSKESEKRNDVMQTPLEAAHASPLLRIEDDLFKGLDISIDNLNTNLFDDDRHSVKSFKSVKWVLGNKILAKRQKLKLRRELFMRKLSSVNQLKKDGQNKQKKKNAVKTDDTNPLCDALPSLGSLLQTTFGSKKISNQPSKARGIQKAKKRRKELVKEVNLYKKILSGEIFKENAMMAISEHIKATVGQQK